MSTECVVQVSVDIVARPATVFRFFSDPTRLRAWLGEGALLDLAAGGSVTVPYPTGDVAIGRVEEVIPETRIAFTWGYEAGTHGMPPGSTRVVIELQTIPTGTRVVLTHQLLPNDEAGAGHRRGWRYYLGLLAARAMAEQTSGTALAAVQAFVAAWNETDAAARQRLLARSFEEAGAFRDVMACIDGRAELTEYIAGAQSFMPGTQLVLTGQPDHVYDRVRFPWRIESADGAVLGAGWNVGRLTLDGRFSEVIGFWGGGPS